MKVHKFPRLRYDAIFSVSIISILLLSSTILKAQSSTNFSGKWEFDKVRSDKEENGDASFDGTIILEIIQNSSTISFANTFILPGKEGIAMQPDSFFVDGRVITDNSGTGPAKKFVKWSQDNKTLTTNMIMTDSIDGVAQDFLVANTYKLSDGGKTLIIKEFHKSKLNGEQTVKKVYSKK
jgi:hypothetical protein